MFPQQQSTGQVQGVQFLGLGSFNQFNTGGLSSFGEGYLCGVLEVNGFAPNNSTQIKFTLTNPELGEFVNDAEVTLTVKDGNGVVILEAQAIDYVPFSDGEYKDTLNIDGQIENQKYLFIINVVGFDGLLYECPIWEKSEYCQC